MNPGGPAPGAIPAAPPAKPPPSLEPERLSDLTSYQWRSGIAAWLGWLFDGLDMHLYILVSAPYVAQLIGAAATSDERVGRYGSWIQAGFLAGWAVGGSLFGRIGDRMGRSRALCFTILTYALFTGLCAVAQSWWQLLIFRFLSALGIGGEWAVGSSLLAETWPKRWRPWVAAVLQSGVNLGILLACLAATLLAGQNPRYLFLVGILPALLVLWIRKAVPEPEEWHRAKAQARDRQPPVADLFRGPVRRVTIMTILICSISLTAWWAFLFWYQQHLRNLPDLAGWTAEAKDRYAYWAMFLVISASIAGNFFTSFLARRLGYPKAIALSCLGFLVSMLGTYGVVRDHQSLLWWLPWVGFCSGVFGLFTMYVPPLFPTLLRTTGAGFSYNIGRLVAAAGTIFFGIFSRVGDHRLVLLYSSVLYLPAIAIALLLPEAEE
jgi:MFS family permease